MVDQDDAKQPLLPPTLPCWWRVLPSMILLMMISTIDSLILNDFIEYRYTTYYQANSTSAQNSRELCLNASQTTHNSSHIISTTTSRYPLSTTMSPNDMVQSANARLNVYISLAATIPSILTSILLGANCDHIGRKPLLVLPYIGKIIRYVILTAVAYYNLSDLWIILSVMFDGVFGTNALNILSSFAFVTDCTNDKTRTAAITITDVCIGAGKFVPLLAMGVYLQHPKFIQSMVFTLLLSVAGFIFCIVLQPESNLNVTHLNIFQQAKQVKFHRVTKIFQVFLAKRSGHKQRTLILLVTVHLSIIVLFSGPLAMYYLYLYGAPFCFDSLGVSLNNIAQTVATILMIIPYTLTIAKRTDHLGLPMLGCLLYMAHLVLFAIAKQVWMIYLAVCIGGTFNVLCPIIRSRITKTVEPTEYAVVFILAGVFESGGYYAISAFANEVYRISLSFYPGLVYFVFAGVGVISICLMLILYILERQPQEKERRLSIND